jgi:hypothetical protein
VAGGKQRHQQLLVWAEPPVQHRGLILVTLLCLQGLRLEATLLVSNLCRMWWMRHWLWTLPVKS